MFDLPLRGVHLAGNHLGKHTNEDPARNVVLLAGAIGLIVFPDSKVRLVRPIEVPGVLSEEIKKID